MVKPQVTITLGRSGQRVVKDSRGGSNGGRAYASVPTGGSKRSMPQSFGTGAARSFKNNKRMREDVNARGYGSSSYLDGNKDSCLGPKDLRRKLTRKRISRRMEIENEERKKIKLHEKVSRAIRSLESPNRNLSRSMPPSRGVAESPSMRSTYATWTTDGERSGMSTPGSAIDERQRVSSMRPMDASRTEYVINNNPMPPIARRPLDSGKFVAELPPATGIMSRSPYQDTQSLTAQPVTVSGLLHSLGLGKYCINFKAEEIDMAALKQMGDIDLKELGIPMGPRKKILLALQARAKRPVAQAHMNYVQ